MSKKMTLDPLRINSFSTTLQKKDVETVKGGLYATQYGCEDSGEPACGQWTGICTTIDPPGQVTRTLACGGTNDPWCTQGSQCDP